MLSQGAFDLETFGLNADYGVLGVCVVYDADTKETTVLRADQMNRRWKSCRSDDSAIVRATAELLGKYDILIAHNGAPGRFGFDLPFLQSRLARHKLPAFARKKIIDPVQIARSQFRLSSNSLEAVSAHIGGPPKLHLAPEVWTRAFLDGDKAAMDTIVERCVSDVQLLVDVVKAVKPYCHQLDHRGSSW